MKKRINFRLIGIALLAVLVTLFGVTSIYYFLLEKQGTSEADTFRNVLITSIPYIFVLIGTIILIVVFLANYLTKKILRPIEKVINSIAETGKYTKDETIYNELEPFIETIRVQHENILGAAKMRQDFTAAVSHELKTPLTAISGYAELIENQMVTPEQEVKFAGEIRKNSHRLLTLINDIIRLSEYDNPKLDSKMESIDLYALAKECTSDLTVSAAKRGISFALSGKDCLIRGNREMIRELIENLCENAIRYNKEGGKVVLFVGDEQGKAILMVADTGIGIPKEHQERVFERFYRVDKSRSRETGGTGLGLAIVKHIVAIHDATIKLESEMGVGTKITVEF